MSEFDEVIGVASPTIAPAAPIAPGAEAGGITPGALGNGVVIMDGEAQIDEILAESNAVPIGLLAVGGLAMAAVSALGSIGGGDVAGAAIAAVGALIGLALITLIATGAAWVVGKIFGQDYGTFGTLVLRVGAINAAHSLAGLGLGMVMPGILVILFGFPLFLVLAIWLLGMDVIQAFMFTMFVTVINVMIVSFVLMSIAAMVFA